MEIVITTISIAFGISFLINLNQMRKQEQLEDYINDLEESNLKYYELFGTLRSRLGDSYSRMKAIDRLGSFESELAGTRGCEFIACSTKQRKVLRTYSLTLLDIKKSILLQDLIRLSQNPL